MRSRFDEQLSQLNREMIEMGALCEEVIALVSQALTEGDTDLASLRLPASDLEGLKSEGKVSSLYPLDYFSNIVKVIPAGTVVDIQLDNDYPVKILFALADGKADVVYFLAPRIESD